MPRSWGSLLLQSTFNSIVKKANQKFAVLLSLLDTALYYWSYSGKLHVDEGCLELELL